jgi:adenosine deaminase
LRHRGRGIGDRRIGRPQAQDRAEHDDCGEPAEGGAAHGAPAAPAGCRPYHAAMDGRPDAPDLAASLRTLPKAELHLHLDGAMRPETAVELARATGMGLEPDDARRRMVAPARCANQAELLSYFDLPISLLQTRAALRRVAGELVRSLAADTVRYAEVRWAPRLHLERGLGVGAVIEAVAEGVEDAASELRDPPRIGLIVTALRSHPPAANVLLAKEAARFGEPVVGFDLAGPEAEWPAPPHAAAFVAAAAGGLALTAHAGEVPGPERIGEALRLGVTRVAHGVTAAGDPKVEALVRDRGVTLDLCPTSNVQAAIVPDLASHPLARLHRAGISVTCSTDDPVVSDTTLSQELARTAVALGLTRVELAAIALNAFRRAFTARVAIESLEREAAAAWTAWAEESASLS